MSIPSTEFAARRAALVSSLRNAVGLVFAGDYDPHLTTPYRPHAHFEYLTGIVDEPGAILLLDPLHPVAARRAMLFLKPLNPEMEQWDGLRDPIGAELRRRTGIETIFRTTALPRWLLESTRRARRFACLHPLAAHTAPIPPDLELFRKVAERIPGGVIEDRSMLLAQMRARKSRAEVAMIQRAIDITAVGFDAVMRALATGPERIRSEFEVQSLIERTYQDNGARDLAFRTIAGGGVNSTVLHYHANDQPLRDGDLICLDSGARFAGYSADITRTLPVNGRFTARQRDVYEVVLAAQRAAIKATRAGTTIMEIDAAARKVIEDAGFGDGFIHGIGHHLGLETHDVSPDAPLPVGAVITIEPGIYLPKERLGVRIEDDVLVGARTSTVLSSLIPKTVEEIESVMSGTQRAGARRVTRSKPAPKRRGKPAAKGSAKPATGRSARGRR
ncbi:MAG: Xaa-Pro peptidase family protein [Phycisphaerales bacterium]